MWASAVGGCRAAGDCVPLLSLAHAYIGREVQRLEFVVVKVAVSSDFDSLDLLFPFTGRLPADPLFALVVLIQVPVDQDPCRSHENRCFPLEQPFRVFILA